LTAGAVAPAAAGTAGAAAAASGVTAVAHWWSPLTGGAACVAGAAALVAGTASASWVGTLGSGWVGSSGREGTGSTSMVVISVGDSLCRRSVASLWRHQQQAGTVGVSLTGGAQPTHGWCPVRSHRLHSMTTTTRTQSAPALKRPDGSPVRVLVVDDEPNLTELLAMALRYEGWEVRSAESGLAAVRAAKEFGPDAVVLDMMLPDFDGLEVLRRMRGDDPNVPVLFLTAKDAVEDRVAGLTAGGDDYVTKPFSLEEVVARLRALMRRTTVATEEGSSLLVVGDLTMDEDSHEVTRSGDQVHLTATEFELLRYLMRNPKRVLSKAQILDRVWNYDFGGQANVVELYISYLRKKIDVGRSPMIHTMRGVGYVLKPAE